MHNVHTEKKIFLANVSQIDKRRKIIVEDIVADKKTCLWKLRSLLVILPVQAHSACVATTPGVA